MEVARFVKTVKHSSIQQYEGRAKDINKAAGATLRSLAQVLSCRIEDLLEYDTSAGGTRAFSITI